MVNRMKLFKRKKKISEQHESIIIKQPASCIYGPPEMLKAYRKGRTDELPEPNNVPEDVYGPPDMLGALQAEEIPEEEE